MSRIRGRYIILAVAAVVLGLALAGGVIWVATGFSTDHDETAAPTPTSLVPATSTPAAAPTTVASPDDRMTQVLIAHGTPADALDRMRILARSTCQNLTPTTDFGNEVSFLANVYHFKSYDAAAVFLTNTIEIYCPVYDDLTKPH